MLLYLVIDGHGGHATKLFGSHSCYYYDYG